MASLVATGTTDVFSSTFTLTIGDTVTLSLTSATDPYIPVGAEARVQMQTSASTWIDIGKLDYNEPAKVLSAPGTFRVLRRASLSTFGVDKV